MATKIDFRYINMDNRRYTTQEGILEYARNFRGGMHRANTDFTSGSVVIGYGRKPFTHSELKAVDDSLQRINDETVVSLNGQAKKD